MADGEKRVHAWITGRVQGVYFRETTRREAERLGVRGWVRNLSDGRVEAVMVGPATAVDRLVAWCRRGPDRAHVEHVEAINEPAHTDGGFGGFEVHPTA